PGHSGNQLQWSLLDCTCESQPGSFAPPGWITPAGPNSPDSDRDRVRVLIVTRQPPLRNSGTDGYADASASDANPRPRVWSRMPRERSQVRIRRALLERHHPSCGHAQHQASWPPRVGFSSCSRRMAQSVSRRVLIVDDDAELAEMLGIVLRAEGF